MREENYLLINTILVSVVIALLIPIMILVIHPSQQKTPLQVSSTVQREVQPDEVAVTISVVTLNKDINESLMENTEKANQIITKFKANPNLKVETHRYNINKKKEWDSNLKTYNDLGYEVTNTITIKTSKLDLAGKIISDSVSLGGNRVQSVVYSLSQQGMNDVRNSMLPEAVANAKIKAVTLSRLMNKKIKGIENINIQEPYFSPIYRSYDNMPMGKAESAPSPNLEPSSQKISLGVTVSFKI